MPASRRGAYREGGSVCAASGPSARATFPRRPRADARLETTDPARGVHAAHDPRSAGARLRDEHREAAEVSVVVVTRDNHPFLRLCLESVLAHTERPCELIVVDNGSTDGTAAYLERLAERNRNLQVIRNAENRGF